MGMGALCDGDGEVGNGLQGVPGAGHTPPDGIE